MSGKSQKITEDYNTDVKEIDEEIIEIAEEYGVENDEAKEIQDIANPLFNNFVYFSDVDTSLIVCSCFSTV